MSTIIDQEVAARVINTTESPFLIERNTKSSEFSVVTPEQFKYIKPVDMATLTLIPEGDPDLSTYLDERLRTKKPEEQNDIFWFRTPENLGKPEDHTPIQTRIL